MAWFNQTEILFLIEPQANIVTEEMSDLQLNSNEEISSTKEINNLFPSKPLDINTSEELFSAVLPKQNRAMEKIDWNLVISTSLQKYYCFKIRMICNLFGRNRVVNRKHFIICIHLSCIKGYSASAICVSAHRSRAYSRKNNIS